MKDHIKTLTAILVIIFVAMLLFGGIFAYWQYQNFKTPKVEDSQIINSNVQNSEAAKTNVLPTKIGQCSRTTVLKVETRLYDGNTGENVVGSGSAIKYTNGGYQVSYDTISGIENSHKGDEINLCLLDIPRDCPPGDDRGKFYGATNLRTGEKWELPDAEHMCGGA